MTLPIKNLCSVIDYIKRAEDATNKVYDILEQLEEKFVSRNSFDRSFATEDTNAILYYIKEAKRLLEDNT